MVLEATRVGRDGAEQALCGARGHNDTQMTRELTDDDAGRGGCGAHDTRLPEGLVRGMVVDDRHMGRAGKHLLGLVQTACCRQIDADEEVRASVVFAGPLEPVGTFKEAIDARYVIVVRQKALDLFVRPALGDDARQGKLGAKGVTVR